MFLKIVTITFQVERHDLCALTSDLKQNGRKGFLYAMEIQEIRKILARIKPEHANVDSVEEGAFLIEAFVDDNCVCTMDF